MDTTSVVLMDHAIRRNPSYYNHDNFLQPKSSSLTFDQQQKLLFLLNNHARCGGGGAVGFLQPSPPSSYVSRNRPPIHASLPYYGQLNQSNPPILPLPFSRSSSLPSPVGGNRRTPRVVQRKKPTLVVTKKKKETPPVPTTTTTTSDVISIKNSNTKKEEEVDYYSLSPPPSSLPLPKFSLKPKV